MLVKFICIGHNGELASSREPAWMYHLLELIIAMSFIFRAWIPWSWSIRNILIRPKLVCMKLMRRQLSQVRELVQGLLTILTYQMG